MVEGLLADDHLSATELRSIERWLHANPGIGARWPASSLAKALRAFSTNEELSTQETENALEALREFVRRSRGVSLDPSDTDSAFDVVELTVDVEGLQICLLGRFEHDCREMLASDLKYRGARVVDDPTRSTDLAIVGSMTGKQWSVAQYARSIHAALELRDEGCPLRIVPEARWNEAVRREFDRERQSRPPSRPTQPYRFDVAAGVGCVKVAIVVLCLLTVALFIVFELL